MATVTDVILQFPQPKTDLPPRLELHHDEDNGTISMKEFPEQIVVDPESLVFRPANLLETYIVIQDPSGEQRYRVSGWASREQAFLCERMRRVEQEPEHS